MTNAEKLQRTIKEIEETWKKLPEWAKVDRPNNSSRVNMTVRPSSDKRS